MYQLLEKMIECGWGFSDKKDLRKIQLMIDPLTKEAVEIYEAIRRQKERNNLEKISDELF